MAATLAAASLLLATGSLANAIGQANVAAGQAVLIPGATVFKPINPFYRAIATSYPKIGMHFHDDTSPTVVAYSQNALAADRAVRDGVRQTKAAVRGTDAEVVVIGESMGSMVAWRVARELAGDNDAPSPADVSFVLIAPPEMGVAEYFKAGTFIPILNYRVRRIEPSPYPTTIVIGEYDGWADPPDRPWNLLASANALAGIAYVHGPPIAAVDPDTVPEQNITRVPATAQHGPITTYFVPTRNLPLTQPFRDLGVPNTLVDKVDRMLRPAIDAGYVRHDKPGDTRPYLRDGELRRNVQSQQSAREPQEQADEPDTAQQRGTSDSAVRDADPPVPVQADSDEVGDLAEQQAEPQESEDAGE
ncbi:PE-PPE domain-containing protein [Mycolicibacterium flavescens]|uniref:PE-PPE domain-containing protein n=1 Tax=Mycolicibacterium flavescens TaxID=1776 RepID=UPI001F19AE7E|nr:PE-PPE domain-containing protein [Mycolicibacterium flavescens]